MSLLSRFSVLISYDMCSSNHFSISSHFPCFSRSRFFRVEVFRVRVLGPCPGSRSRFRVQVQLQDPSPESRVQVQVIEVALFYGTVQSYEKHQKYITCCSAGYIRWVYLCNIYDKDKELKNNLRKPPKLSYLALRPGNNKQNVPLALERTITAVRSYFPN